MKKAETKDRIRKALSIRNMKQSELVEKTGIDKGQMSSYLSGRYKPKQENLYLIAQALCVDEAWLMGFDVPMERQNDNNLQKEEKAKIMQYYDLLNDIGKHEATKRVIELTEVPRYLKGNSNYVNAAHADDNSTPEEQQAGDNIMMDDSEWE